MSSKNLGFASTYLFGRSASFVALFGLLGVLLPPVDARAEEPVPPVPSVEPVAPPPLPPPAVNPQPVPPAPSLQMEPDDLRAMQSRPDGRPVLEPQSPPDILPVWTGMNRFTARVRPMWTLFNYYGGGLIDIGFEHIAKYGLLLGADVASAAILYPMLGVQGRVRIGYGGPRFAIGAGVGGGAGTFEVGSRQNNASYVYAQVGAFMRIGRLERTYAELSVNVAVPYNYPFNALFHLSARTTERWRFKMDLGVEMMIYGPYLIMGGERLLSGNGSRGSSAINFGVGLVFPIFFFGIPGPTLSIGYERRF